MTAVKICGLTNLGDARWAWECGADLLGFILVPGTPRYVPPEDVGCLASALRAEGCGALLVGVVAGEGVDVVDRVAAAAGLDLVQLHGADDAELLERLRTPAILVHRVRDAIPWAQMRGDAWGHLLDAYHPAKLGGTGERWRWELLAGRPAGGRRILVGGGLTPDTVAEAVRVARPWGVDASSGVEATVRVKDPQKVRRFIVEAKAAG